MNKYEKLFTAFLFTILIPGMALDIIHNHKSIEYFNTYNKK